MKKLPTLRGRTVVNLFFESSTRTSSSFELAAKRLSADMMSIKAARLVGGQGRVAQGHGAHARRLRPGRDRHPPPADRRAAARRRGRPTRTSSTPATASTSTRPRRCSTSTRSSRSSAASRGCTSRSSATCSTRASRARTSRRSSLVRRARDARRAADADPARDRGARLRGRRTTSTRSRDADVVYVLRMQRERMQEGANYVPSLREYTARWGVTPERLRPGQKVMHPGPMNRGVEIDPRVADARRRADRDAGARRARRPHGRALRPAHARAGRRADRGRAGGGVMALLCKQRLRRTTSSIAARASSIRRAGIDDGARPSRSRTA